MLCKRLYMRAGTARLPSANVWGRGNIPWTAACNLFQHFPLQVVVLATFSFAVGASVIHSCWYLGLQASHVTRWDHWQLLTERSRVVRRIRVCLRLSCRRLHHRYSVDDLRRCGLRLSWLRQDCDMITRFFSGKAHYDNSTACQYHYNAWHCSNREANLPVLNQLLLFFE